MDLLNWSWQDVQRLASEYRLYDKIREVTADDYVIWALAYNKLEEPIKLMWIKYNKDGSKEILFKSPLVEKVKRGGILTPGEIAKAKMDEIRMRRKLSFVGVIKHYQSEMQKTGEKERIITVYDSGKETKIKVTPQTDAFKTVFRRQTEVKVSLPESEIDELKKIAEEKGWSVMLFAIVLIVLFLVLR